MRDTDADIVRITQLSRARDFASDEVLLQSLREQRAVSIDAAQATVHLPRNFDLRLSQNQQLFHEDTSCTEDVSSRQSHGINLYIYMIFNLALSVPLSLLCIIFMVNMGGINDRFLIDSKVSFNEMLMWKYILSSIFVDLSVLICYIFWVDYCLKGLVLFRYIAVLVQIVGEQLSGYRGKEASQNLHEARALFLSKFSLRKWLNDAIFRMGSRIDIYKFHSILILGYAMIIFMIRNHIHPQMIPPAFHLVTSVLLCVFLLLSMASAILVQTPCSSRYRRRAHRLLQTTLNNLRRILNSLSVSSNQPEHFFDTYYSSQGFHGNIQESTPLTLHDDYHTMPSSPRNSNSLVAFLNKDTKKESLASVLIENLFVCALYLFIGSGSIILSLRMDQIALLDVDPYLLFIPFFCAFGITILYNLVMQLKMSYQYVCQKNRLQSMLSVCVMSLFFVFTLVQSMCLVYLTIGYTLKIHNVGSLEWMHIFLPLSIFEILFSIIGLALSIVALIRTVSWMFSQAHTVSRSADDEAPITSMLV